MALGFPGQSGEMYEVFGRDAFLNALEDQALRIRVLDQQPQTLDDALSIATRMESYSGNTGINIGNETAERKHVRFSSPNREADAEQRIRSLEEQLERQSEEIKRLKRGGALAASRGGARRGSHGGVPGGGAHGGAPRGSGDASNYQRFQQRGGDPRGNRGRGQGQRTPYDTCKRCGGKDHWRRECTAPGYTATGGKAKARTHNHLM